MAAWLSGSGNGFLGRWSRFLLRIFNWRKQSRKDIAKTTRTLQVYTSESLNETVRDVKRCF